jgi:hypothetical protein
MSEDSLNETAKIMARCWPDVQERLRQEHRPGPDGRCLGCTSQVRAAPRWPCGLAYIAGAVIANDDDDDEPDDAA